MKLRVFVAVVIVVALGALAYLAWRSPSEQVAMAPRPAGRAPVAPPHAVPGSSRVAAPDARVAPAAPVSTLPTSLPDTPAVATWLHEQGVPDAREMHDYLLALNAHVDDCMRGAVVRGQLHYWLHWTIDEDHVGRGSYEPDTTMPPTGFDDDARERLERCVGEYLAEHEIILPSYGGEGRSDLHWTATATFPVTDQEVYRVIANQGLP
jgi:hypothetical protein